MRLSEHPRQDDLLGALLRQALNGVDRFERAAQGALEDLLIADDTRRAVADLPRQGIGSDRDGLWPIGGC